MIRIGQFANACGISVKTVRFYESKGLIQPSYIDHYTGYRYYDEANVERIMQILFYKDLGFTLKEIKNLNHESIIKKVSSLKEKIILIQDNIKKLEKMIRKGEEKMSDFINDELVIGKWELVGRIEDPNECLVNKIVPSDFLFKELYFLPNGENYWVLGWLNYSHLLWLFLILPSVKSCGIIY